MSQRDKETSCESEGIFVFNDTQQPKPNDTDIEIIASSTLPPSLINSIDNDSQIGEITEETDNALMSTSAVLFYCKSKILYPYLKFLAIVGLRPVSLNQINNSKFTQLLSHYHTLQITILVCLGYVLQYMACFRRDRGFYLSPVTTASIFNNHSALYEQTCYGSTSFTYLMPAILHLAGYIYAIYLFRISDSEHLQNLMERVFLLSSFPPQSTSYTNPKKLLRTLWLFVLLSVFWMMFTVIIVYIMISKNTIVFQWIDHCSVKIKFGAKILLVICTLSHDMVQATIITNYCLQAQLLTAHLHFLRNRLLTRTISPLDWMREVAEFKKLLIHLNEVLAPSICLFTIVNICWTCSGIFWLSNLDKTDSSMNPISGVNILNLLAWILAATIPFISAARLTTACSMTQGVGHEIIVRPFLHQETPQDDLNAVLLYASSLNLSARLFRLPITGKHLCMTMTVLSVGIITLGMCHYISI